MNKDENAKMQKSGLTRKILLWYLGTSILFVIVFTACTRWAIEYYRGRLWYDTDMLYRLIYWIKEYPIVWYVAILVIGGVLIGYCFIAQTLHYLDGLIAVSGGLIKHSTEPILLPAPLRNIQDELNLVREQGIFHAMAAKEAEQRKNDLIVYLAHDLKTPLTSVIGYLTLLKDEPQISGELRAKYTGIALEKAERLEDLINEFFDITRFNLTHLTLETEKIDLTLMLKQITYEFNPIMKEKGLIWDLELEPDIEILCDPDKLQRVFDNLLRNAVNYSYKNSTVTVWMRRFDEKVVISIQNKGKTISSDKLERIFDQFFRLDSSRATATGGAGLGLAIAKEIAELHGGNITVASADESITFTLILPLSHHKIV